MRPLNIIVAVDQNGGFGYRGNIPWKNEPFIKDDFKRFKTLTQDSICMMGYKTYEEIVAMRSLQGKDPNEPILPGRQSYVLTSRALEIPETPSAKFAVSIRDVVEGMIAESDNREVFVLGGEKLFIESLPWTRHIYMTIVKNTYDCDRFFPFSYVDEHFIIIEKEETEYLFFVTFGRVR